VAGLVLVSVKDLRNRLHLQQDGGRGKLVEIGHSSLQNGFLIEMSSHFNST
jgi:hypothetical protein